MEKLTDEQIVKALEVCGNIVDSRCKECAYHETYNASCVVRLMCDALDLINRQKEAIAKKDTEIDILMRKKDALNDEVFALKAEIDDLNIELKAMRGSANSYKKLYDDAQKGVNRLQVKIEVIQEAKEQLEKDVFNSEMNCDAISYEYELLKQEKSVVKSEARKEFAERLKEHRWFTVSDKRYIDNLLKEMDEQ